MDENQLHALICKHFARKMRPRYQDNLPLLLKKGGRNTLAVVLAEAGLNRGAEIGVKKGEFSKVLCEANPNIELYCVDIWEVDYGTEAKYSARRRRYLREAKRNLGSYNAKLVHKYSMDAIKDFEDGSLDFVYIDAAHDFDHCCPDIIFWSQKVHSGGIVACHDYYQFRHGGVVRAVDAYVQSHRIDPWYVTYEIMPTAFWVKP